MYVAEPVTALGCDTLALLLMEGMGGNEGRLKDVKIVQQSNFIISTHQFTGNHLRLVLLFRSQYQS